MNAKKPVTLKSEEKAPAGRCCALEIWRHDRANWRVGLGTLDECMSVHTALVDLPQFAGAVFVIRRRVRAGVYEEAPVWMSLNTAGLENFVGVNA